MKSRFSIGVMSFMLLAAAVAGPTVSASALQSVSIDGGQGSSVNQEPTKASPSPIIDVYARLGKDGDAQLSGSPKVWLAVTLNPTILNPASVKVLFRSVEDPRAYLERGLRWAGESVDRVLYSADVNLGPSAPAGVWNLTHVSIFDGETWHTFSDKSATVIFTDRVNGQPGGNFRVISMSPVADPFVKLRLFLDPVPSSWWGDQAVQLKGRIIDPRGGVHFVEYTKLSNGWQAELTGSPMYVTGEWQLHEVEVRYVDGTSLRVSPEAEFGDSVTTMIIPREEKSRSPR